VGLWEAGRGEMMGGRYRIGNIGRRKLMDGRMSKGGGGEDCTKKLSTIKWPKEVGVKIRTEKLSTS
jgi:hypothetical protein